MSDIAKKFHEFRARLAQRDDSEHEQAILRIVIVATVLAYMLGTSESSLRAIDPVRQVLYATLILDLAFAVLVFASICLWPSVNVPRRIAGMFADAGTATVVMLTTGEAGVAMVGVFLFITFGNGFRYGRRYLFGCQVLCLAGFIAALAGTSYWRAHQVAGWSLFIALVVLPLYVSTLLTRIQEARSKAEEANRAKSTFLANMSHEMRTPLNGIVGVVDLLQVTQVNAQQGDLIRLLRHSVGVMRSLVDDVLDISKIEAGRLTIEVLDFDLHSMLNGLVRLLKPHAQAKGLRLTALIDPSIDYDLRGDPHHLRQVLLNLLSNAIKFTSAGEIQIRVSLVGENASVVRVRFEVRDTGIGISEEVKHRIFERFVQADESTTRRYGGTGLGTTIAKQLVELMSGTIGVESKVGKGSTFWFEIPLTAIDDKQSPLHVHLGAAVLLADASTAARIGPSVAAACGSVEMAGTASEVLSQLKALRAQGLRVPAVLVAGDPMVASEVFEAVARDCGDVSTAMIYLAPADKEQSREEKLLTQREGISRIVTSSNPRLLRNAIHAVAAHESESAQVIDLGQVLAEQRVPRRILVAEDNETNRAIIVQLLENAGHSVIIAEDGEEALDVYERDSPDIAIVDFNMPLRNGVDVTLAIRAMEVPTQRLPILMLSASVTQESRDRAKRAGVDDFLGKPYEGATLLQVIDRLGRRADRSPPRHLDSSRASTAQITTLTPLIDAKRILEVERIAGDAGFLKKLLSGFYGDVEKLLVKLDAAIEREQATEIGDITHAIKGAAVGIGAAKLASMCQAIDTAASERSFSKLSALAKETRRCFHATFSELEVHTANKQRASNT